MMFHREDDRLFVIASNSGAPRHPAWYGNLVADPDVVVEVGEETYQARATPLEGGEHARVWAAITAAYPFFREHAERAGRTIPVVELVRAG